MLFGDYKDRKFPLFCLSHVAVEACSPVQIFLRKYRKQIPAIVAGKKSKKQAMIDAGYAESSANQHAVTFGGVRTNSAMQQALRDAGFDEKMIAEKVAEGLEAERIFVVRDGEDNCGYAARSR